MVRAVGINASRRKTVPYCSFTRPLRPRTPCLQFQLGALPHAARAPPLARFGLHGVAICNHHETRHPTSRAKFGGAVLPAKQKEARSRQTGPSCPSFFEPLSAQQTEFVDWRDPSCFKIPRVRGRARGQLKITHFAEGGTLAHSSIGRGFNCTAGCGAAARRAARDDAAVGEVLEKWWSLAGSNR